MEGISDTQRILELQFTQSFTTGNLIIDTVIKGKAFEWLLGCLKNNICVKFFKGVTEPGLGLDTKCNFSEHVISLCHPTLSI